MRTETKLAYFIEHEQRLMNVSYDQSVIIKHHKNQVMLKKYKELLKDLDWDELMEFIQYVAEEYLGCDCW